MHREDLMNPDLLSKIVLLGSAASKEQTAVGRIVPLHSCSLDTMYNGVTLGACSQLHRT
jgi:hypothetical protein